MLIVPDVQDVYTPLQTDVIVPLSEVSFTYFSACRVLVDKLSYIWSLCLLYSIPLIVGLAMWFFINWFASFMVSAVNT